MDFPAAAVTNFRLNESFSTVCWRLYLPIFPKGLTQLHGASTLTKTVVILQRHGVLVSPQINVFGLWIFSTSEEFDRLMSFRLPGRPSDGLILVDGVKFCAFGVGSATLPDVMQNLSKDNAAGLPMKFPPYPFFNNSQKTSAFIRSVTTYLSFYEAFVSAVSVSLQIHLARCQGSIFLGQRTLFTPLHDGVSHEFLSYANSQPSSFISTPTVDITSNGKLILSAKPVFEHSLERVSVSSPVNSGDDIWIAPVGKICRFVSFTKNGQQGTFLGGTGALRETWKSAVCRWLDMFGLQMDDESENWVELEIMTNDLIFGNYFAQAIGISVLPSPVLQIVWPAKYCFRRTYSKPPSSVSDLECFSTNSQSSLEFAESWLLKTQERIQILANKQESPNQVADPPIKPEIPEFPESLARIIRCPNFASQAPLYPTPPDIPGQTNFGLTHPPDSVTSGADGPTHLQKPDHEPSALSNVVMQNNDATSDLTGTSEMYIDNIYDKDDDLFGDLGATELGERDLTEADLNFFDDLDSAQVESVPMENEVSQKTNQREALSSFVDRSSLSPKEMPVVSASLENRGGPNSNHIIATALDTTNENTLVPSEKNQSNHFPQSVGESDAGSVIARPMSPPLSPIEIQKILFPERPATGQTYSRANTKHSLFEPVNFGHKVVSDEKYDVHGRFWFTGNQFQRPTNHNLCVRTYPSTIPTLQSLGDTQNVSSSAINTLNAGFEQFGSQLHSHVSSDDSDDSDDSFTFEYVTSASPMAGYKRKRSPGDSPGSMTEMDQASDEKLTENCFALLGSFLVDSPKWSLVPNFFISPNAGGHIPIQREEINSLARLVVEQTVQTTLKHEKDGYGKWSENQLSQIPNLIFLDNIAGLGHTEKLDLKGLTVANTQPQASRDNENQLTLPLVSPGYITKIPLPHVRVYRGKYTLEALASLIVFWKIFSLRPLSGEKDCVAYCLHPGNTSEGAGAFLDRMSLVYAGANLGKHTRSTDSGGLLSWELDASKDYTAVMNTLCMTCAKFGTALANSSTCDETIVLYVVNPFPEKTAIVDICSCFLRLLNNYIKEFPKNKRAQAVNNIVLQIIPLGFIASPESLVVPSEDDYMRLALEIYARCPQKDQSSGTLRNAPPFFLAERPPNGLPLKLTADFPSPTEEPRYIHIAYSLSPDARWVTAAWTDNIGHWQTTISYCLKERNGTLSRSLAEIRREIWEATVDILDVLPAHRRIVLARVGPIYSPDETNVWNSLLDSYNENKRAKVEITVVSVDPHPGLFFSLPHPPLHFNTICNSQSAIPTSNSRNTPLDHITGHESPNNSSTGITLVDRSDDVWAVGVPYLPNNSPAPDCYHPARAAGYLARRRDTSDTEGLASLGVGVLYSSSERSADALLKEIMFRYRDLTTLARMKGIRFATGDTALPWHIGTALKGAETLSAMI